MVCAGAAAAPCVRPRKESPPPPPLAESCHAAWELHEGRAVEVSVPPTTACSCHAPARCSRHRRRHHAAPRCLRAARLQSAAPAPNGGECRASQRQPAVRLSRQKAQHAVVAVRVSSIVAIADAELSCPAAPHLLRCIVNVCRSAQGGPDFEVVLVQRLGPVVPGAARWVRGWDGEECDGSGEHRLGMAAEAAATMNFAGLCSTHTHTQTHTYCSAGTRNTSLPS
mgnify:CR=1 FL=1